MNYHKNTMTMMKQAIIKHGASLLCLVVGLVFAGGCGGPEAEDGDDRPTVVATTTMIEDLAKVIGGEEINIVGMMRTGEDPHLYEVKPKHATSVKNADLVLMNGLHLEATLDTIIKEQATGKVVALAEQEGIEPLTGGAGLEVAADPHCWMDTRYYGIYAAAVAEALSEVAPQHEALFKERLLVYLDELGELDAWIKKRFDEVPERQRVIVTGHDAFAYFGKAYGIEVHGLIGISTEQEPTPQDIEKLKTLIRDNGIRAVFPESSLGGSLLGLLDKVAADTGAVVGEELHSDSLGEPGSEAGTYLGMMRHNTNTMVEALKGGGE
ncbi:MAG: metal ABC transporter substrate-binding protein [Phycisphaeraceae bacterium]|nr:metal ABC transporter substrate-binding protein [Phycisphaeraceae bacterium]